MEDAGSGVAVVAGGIAAVLGGKDRRSQKD
jgi:hypothetical protein